MACGKNFSVQFQFCINALSHSAQKQPYIESCQGDFGRDTQYQDCYMQVQKQ